MTRILIGTLLSHWRRHPIQFATLVLGLALATALWSGVQALNAQAKASYATAAARTGQTPPDRLVGRDPVTLAQFVALRRAGWLVSPVIEAPLPGTNLTLRGVDPITAPPSPALAPLGDDNLDIAAFLSAPGIMLVAPEAQPNLPPGLQQNVRVSGTLEPDIVLTDIRTAQALLGTEAFSYLILRPEQPRGLPPLADVTDLARQTAPERADLAELTDSFHLNLTAFGFLSFAVGLFIVQSAIGLAFEARRPTFRTLRALGVSLPHLLTTLAIELVALAILAGIVGLVLGYFIAASLLPGVAGTLRGLYGADVSGVLQFDVVWALSALAMTLLGTVAAGGHALWKVAKMPLLAPARPRAWAQASRQTLKYQALFGLFLVILASLLAVFGASLLTGFACLAALLLGAALALPYLLVRALDLAENWATGPMGEWAVADTRQQVPALSLALMALLLALAANIGVSTMVGSFRSTFTGWLDQRLTSELYISVANPTQAATLRDLADTSSDIEALLPITSADTTVEGQPAEIFGIIDHATYRSVWPLLEAVPDVWDRLARNEGVLINEQLARRADLWSGATVSISSEWSEPVLGVYSDYGNPQAQLLVQYDAFKSRYPNADELRYGIRTSDADAVRSLLSDELGLTDSNMVNQQELKALSLRVFEQTFLVTGALNVLTLAVAGFAILASLLTLSGLRLPQLAPLWALGQSPGWLARVEVLRTIALALLTLIVALPVGLALAWVLLSVVNVHAFGWRLPMVLFPLDWVRLGFWALVAAALAAAWPAIRLTRLPNAALLRSFASDR